MTMQQADRKKRKKIVHNFSKRVQLQKLIHIGVVWNGAV